MRFEIKDSIKQNICAPKVGNVYGISGGRSSKDGHMYVIVGIKDSAVTVLTINKSGEVCGGRCYGHNYFEEKTPIAYCTGVDDLCFEIRELGV